MGQHQLSLIPEDVCTEKEKLINRKITDYKSKLGEILRAQKSRIMSLKEWNRLLEHTAGDTQRTEKPRVKAVQKKSRGAPLWKRYLQNSQIKVQNLKQEDQVHSRRARQVERPRNSLLNLISEEDRNLFAQDNGPETERKRILTDYLNQKITQLGEKTRNLEQFRISWEKNEKRKQKKEKTQKKPKKSQVKWNELGFSTFNFTRIDSEGESDESSQSDREEAGGSLRESSSERRQLKRKLRKMNSEFMGGKLVLSFKPGASDILQKKHKASVEEAKMRRIQKLFRNPNKFKSHFLKNPKRPIQSEVRSDRHDILDRVARTQIYTRPKSPKVEQRPAKKIEVGIPTRPPTEKKGEAKEIIRMKDEVQRKPKNDVKKKDGGKMVFQTHHSPFLKKLPKSNLFQIKESELSSSKVSASMTPVNLEKVEPDSLFGSKQSNTKKFEITKVENKPEQNGQNMNIDFLSQMGNMFTSKQDSKSKDAVFKPEKTHKKPVEETKNIMNFELPSLIKSKAQACRLTD